MARGPKKHLKRLVAPKHWMMDKLGGVYAPRPRPGPHKLQECLPLILIVRNKLKYALTGREAMAILKQRLLKVDGKVRTDPKYPAGFMDVVTLEKSGDKFRILYDQKGRFVLHKIGEDEEQMKLCKVEKVMYGPKRSPFLRTHDGRTINYPDPNLKKNDTIVLDTETGKPAKWIRFKPGCLITCTGGANKGRVGTVVTRERHPGSFDIVHVKDAADNKFATRMNNVFVIGSSAKKPMVSLPKAKGIRLDIAEDREKKLAHAAMVQRRTQTKRRR